MLRQKFALGLFDNDPKLLYVDPVVQAATMDAPAHRDLARLIAEEGVTLLKNDGNRLPLTGLGDKIKTIAVIGPNADNTHGFFDIIFFWDRLSPIVSSTSLRTVRAPWSPWCPR